MLTSFEAWHLKISKQTFCFKFFCQDIKQTESHAGFLVSGVSAEFLRAGNVQQLEKQNCEYQSKTYILMPLN